MFKNALIYGIYLREEHCGIVQRLVQLLKMHGCRVAVHGDFRALLKKHCNGAQPIDSWGEDIALSEVDLIITLGGDGTILSVVQIAYDRGIPILGINLGRLGFLSAVRVTELEQSIHALFEGKFRRESRSLLQISTTGTSLDDFPYALNDFTIRRTDTSGMVRISVYIDGVFLHDYWSDGLIISTPTGSTAYSLSCGGPILFPNTQNFVITSVAPHNLSVRPVVVHDDATVRIIPFGRAKQFMITLDSRYDYIPNGFELQVRKSPYSVDLLYLEDMDFIHRLREKLHWGRDERNG